jgi:pilus assembly protein Flp/PilA
MNTMLLKLYVKFQDLMSREEGQDLIEYALLVALISLAAVAAITGLASNMTAVFSKISSTFALAL